MKPNKICTRSFIMAMTLVAVFALTAAWPCASSAAGPAECSLIGTWYGEAGSTLSWLGVQTAGSTITSGEMALNWVRVRNSLLTINGYQATRLTDGHGVWEQTRKGQYKYTWYAYGIGASANDPPIYSVRISGTAENMAQEGLNLSSCDFIAIYYTYEVFDGFLIPQDMSEATPVATIEGAAAEVRVPLTVVPPTTP